MILALDISTRLIGCCVMNVKTESVALLKHIDLRKIDNLFERVIVVKNELNDIFNKFDGNIDEVVIEDFARKFTRGKSSANTITKVAGFNYMVSFLIYYFHKIMPMYKAAISCRKIVGLKIPKNCDTKATVLEFVKKRLPNHKWEKTRFGNDQVFEYDKADAYIVALSRVKELKRDS